MALVSAGAQEAGAVKARVGALALEMAAIELLVDGVPETLDEL